MKFLFDLLPIILFVVAYKLYGLYPAIVVIMVATAIQVGLTWLKQRKVEKMHLITLALVVILGGATLLLQDKAFFMWKPTAVNWLFALAFLGSHFIGSR
ncbi:MAG TPA: septation protein IspZ, partial [Gammaproteobacteria bacterium]